MKKLICVFLVFVVMSSTVFADNSERITELQKEQGTLQQQLAQSNQLINNIQIRLIQIQAVLNELSDQDTKKKK